MEGLIYGYAVDQVGHREENPWRLILFAKGMFLLSLVAIHATHVFVVFHLTHVKPEEKRVIFKSGVGMRVWCSSGACSIHLRCFM